MPYIGKEPVAGNFVLLDSITTSATATYALTKDSVAYSPESARNMIVSLNGVTQAPETAFTVSGSNITFSSALTSSDVIDYILVLGDVLSVGTPSDGTVGTSQMSYPLGNFSSTGIDDNATSTAVTINSSQNVGIGTTSPVSTAKLSISDASIAAISIDNTSGRAYELISTSTGLFGLLDRDAVAYRMLVDSSGNVGIGTTSPSTYSNAPELVVDTGTAGGITVKSGTLGYGALFFADGTSGNEQYRGFIQYNHDYTGVEDSLLFGTSGVEAMRISSNGQLKIGGTTNSPANVQAVLFGTGNASLIYDTGHTGLHINNENATAGSGNYGAGISFGRFASNSDDQSAAIVPVQTTTDQDHMGIAFLTHDTNTRANPLKEKMRIMGSGNVGIGTTSPDRTLSIQGDSGTNIPLTVESGSGQSNCLIAFRDPNTTQPYNVAVGADTDDLICRAGGTERMRILSSGGITFNGDTAAANALDDYEEGTWTPTFFDDGASGTDLTYSQQTGTYTKIGRLVYLRFRITVSAKGGTGSGQGLFIASLPFNIGYFSTTVSTAMFDANQADNITNVSAPEELSAYSFSFNPTVLYLLSSGGSVNSNSVQSNTVLEGSIIYYA